MTADGILSQLTEGTVLEGPHWTEAVRVLTAELVVPESRSKQSASSPNASGRSSSSWRTSRRRSS